MGYPWPWLPSALAGVLQVILAKLKVARLSAIFPAAAMQGMLAAIGLIMIAKQIPLFMGVKLEAHEIWAVLGEVPATSEWMNHQVSALGVGCLAALFVL